MSRQSSENSQLRRERQRGTEGTPHPPRRAPVSAGNRRWCRERLENLPIPKIGEEFWCKKVNGAWSLAGEVVAPENLLVTAVGQCTFPLLSSNVVLEPARNLDQGQGSLWGSVSLTSSNSNQTSRSIAHPVMLSLLKVCIVFFSYFELLSCSSIDDRLDGASTVEKILG